MYTERERDELLKSVTQYICDNDEFRGLVRIGSCADGFRDIYSDIDLMAACQDVTTAGEMLHDFFRGLGAVYIDSRRWSEEVLGYSAYWENGLSVDISFMPTHRIPVLSDRIAIVFSRSDAFTNRIQTGLRDYRPTQMDHSGHHTFFYALRRCEIAVLRGEHIYADMCLAEARSLLLGMAAGPGGDPKRFNALEPSFLRALEQTYPAARDRDTVNRAKEELLALYTRTAGIPGDSVQLKLIGCFE